MTYQADFWRALEKLVQESTIIIDRPKGSSHPQYGDLIYPLDYGYLNETTTTDDSGIDVWRGSQPDQNISAVLCTVDLAKRDLEIKVLIGCDDGEIASIEHFHNQSANMKGFLIKK